MKTSVPSQKIILWGGYIVLAYLVFRVASINIRRSQMSFADTNEPKPILTVDKVTGLTVYESNDGKFRLKYPSDLIIHVNYVHVRNTTSYHPVSNVVELDSPTLNKAPYVLLQYSQNLVPQTVHDYVLNSSECEDVETLKGEPVSIAGVSGLLFKNITCSSKGETRLYFIKNNLQYNLIIAGKPVDDAFLATLMNNFEFIQ